MTSSKVENNPKWNYDTIHDVLIACVGHNFGPNPETRLEEIRKSRVGRGERIIYELQLNSSHAVADLGSGCGFVDRPIAPRVKHITCIDISDSFLEYCKMELAEFDNVSYCLSNYGRFVGVPSESLDAVFSTAVWIHFNYYDFVIYLQETARVLKNNGILLIEILNADILNVHTDTSFSEHLRNYPFSREQHIFHVVQPFSLHVLHNLAPQLGFFVENVKYLRNYSTTTVILRKMENSSPRLG